MLIITVSRSLIEAKPYRSKLTMHVVLKHAVCHVARLSPGTDTTLQAKRTEQSTCWGRRLTAAGLSAGLGPGPD
jgi:hypothetical protein